MDRIKDAISLIQQEIDYIQKRKIYLTKCILSLQALDNIPQDEGGNEQTSYEPEFNGKSSIDNDVTQILPIPPVQKNTYGANRVAVTDAVERYGPINFAELSLKLTQIKPASIQSCLQSLSQQRIIVKDLSGKFSILFDKKSEIVLTNDLQKKILEVIANGTCQYTEIMDKSGFRVNPNVFNTAMKYLKKHGYILQTGQGYYGLPSKKLVSTTDYGVNRKIGDFQLEILGIIEKNGPLSKYDLMAFIKGKTTQQLVKTIESLEKRKEIKFDGLKYHLSQNGV